jgi:hypothetical protein
LLARGAGTCHAAHTTRLQRSEAHPSITRVYSTLGHPQETKPAHHASCMLQLAHRSTLWRPADHAEPDSQYPMLRVRH